ncbi:C4-dicarboxylate ABC transporter [Agrococcus baldri]|uniref:C4-dicarboxylate ABC transporter n=2 Tax=Agrococcus baldri TaxID=153730 RepID=A0AA87RGH2_9MICO|nr:C4-dicarboxylate ABC transporter [Agrococcus baldri]
MAGLAAIAVTLSGCASSSATTGSEGEASGAETVQFALTVSIAGSPGNTSVEMIPDIVSEATDGRVTVEIVEDVVGPTELLPALSANRFAGGHVYTDYMAATYPAWHVGAVPGLILNEDDIPRIMEEVVLPVMNEDVTREADATSLAIVGTMNTVLWTGDQPVPTAADWQGLSIRANSAFTIQTFRAQGASPIEMPFSEVYGSLERQIIDGTVASATDIKGVSLHEVLRYGNFFPLGLSSNQFIFTNSFLDSLSDDERAALEEGMEEFEEGLFPLYQEQYEASLAELSELGIEMVEPSESEVEAYVENGQPVYDWFASEEGAGERGAQMLSEIRDITGH